MAFTPKTWATDDNISDTELNRIETGIDDVTDDLAALETALDALSHVSVYHDVATSIPDSTETVIPWASEYYDSETEHSAGTFTATVTGYYHVSAHVGFSSGTWDVGKIAELRLYANSQHRCSGTSWESQVNTTHKPSCSLNHTVYLEATQTIQIKAYQDSGGARTLNSSGSYNRLSIDRLR
ncbi:MAG: hypothetical protein JRC93_04010 [Deltaproteobacteria bacterium]|nr:hypothetical protein [Deltaproteobacteria bacterium]